MGVLGSGSAVPGSETLVPGSGHPCPQLRGVCPRGVVSGGAGDTRAGTLRVLLRIEDRGEGVVPGHERLGPTPDRGWAEADRSFG